MFAFIAGAAAVIGLIGIARMARYRMWHHHGHTGHHHRRRGWRGRWLYRVLDRLDATPAQEKEIAKAVDDLLSTMHRARSGLDDARAELAKAMRSETLGAEDAAQATAPFAVHFDDLRSTAAETLRRIHAVLDEKQRAELARLLERTHGFGHAH